MLQSGPVYPKRQVFGLQCPVPFNPLSHSPCLQRQAEIKEFPSHKQKQKMICFSAFFGNCLSIKLSEEPVTFHLIYDLHLTYLESLTGNIVAYCSVT